MRKIDKDRRVLLVAQRQLGVIHRDQLLSCGLTRSDIHRRLATGTILRALPRVFRISGAPESWESLLVASLLWAGPESAVSHRAAGRVWALAGIDCEFAEISLLKQQRCPGDWVTVHRSSDLSWNAVVRRGNLRITDATRTVIDLASVVPRYQFEIAAEDALSRRLTSITRIERMLSDIQRSGRPGVEQVRDFLEARAPGGAAESPAEIKLLEIIRAAGLPDPVRQLSVPLANGTIFRPDLAYPAERILIEFDSYQFHSGLRPWSRDRARRNQLTAEGWTVLQATSEDLKHPAALIKQIRELLEQSLTRG